MEFSTFATIGFFIFLIILAFFVFIYYYQRIQDKEIKTNIVFPPAQYMKDVGSKCPDYWVYTGLVNGKDQCTNLYNVPVRRETCKQIENNNQVRFTPFVQWPPDSSLALNKNALQERQSFMNNCGSYINMESVQF
jgi:hypothetical protein